MISGHFLRSFFKTYLIFLKLSKVKSSEKDDELEVMFSELREAKALLEVTVENGERQIQVTFRVDLTLRPTTD